MNASGILFFAADDGSHGNELWKSDGTEAGTVLVGDLAPGLSSSSPSQLMIAGLNLFFAADDQLRGNELWAINIAKTTVYLPSMRK